MRYLTLSLFQSKKTMLSGIIIVSLLVISLSLVLAQEDPPEPETPTETPLLTNTEAPPPTETPLPTNTEEPPPTEPPLPTNTEQLPTETLVLTEILPLTETDTPTEILSEETSEVISTLEPTIHETAGFLPSPTPEFGVPSSPRTVPRLLPQSVNMVNLPPESTTQDLIDALVNANPSTCQDHTVINLPASHVYVLTTSNNNFNNLGATGLPIIRCEVTINGENTQIIRNTLAPNFRIFGVDSTGILRLNGINIQNGYATNTGGGAILNVFGGEVYIYDTVIENNTANQTSAPQTLGGGIYSYEGVLYVENSRIANNTNSSQVGDGGGIGVINATTTIITSDITGNTTTRNGGGIAILFISSGAVNNNCITSNSSDGLFANFGVNATNNWWGATDGPSGLGPGTGNAVNGSAIIIPFKDTLIPCGIGTSIWTLADFGITLLSDGQAWVPQEEDNILTGANRVANALLLFVTKGNSFPDKFKTVMGTNVTFLRLAQTRPSITDYGEYYDVFDGQSPSSGYCQVFDPTLVIPTTAVVCRGPISQTTTWITNGLVTEYLVVHELGHVLDIHSGTLLRDYVGDSALFLSDCTSARVMGIAPEQPWVRGQRGWGSTAPDASNGQEISQFQQNPYDQSSHIETAADMFLNWVYRRTTDAAPTNIPSHFDPILNASPPPADACNYDLEGDWQGFKNINRGGTSDTTRPGNVRYWWMEGTLNVIFLNQSWK